VKTKVKVIVELEIEHGENISKKQVEHFASTELGETRIRTISTHYGTFRVIETARKIDSSKENLSEPTLSERTFEYVRDKWNKQADQFNQWNELDDKEMVNFAVECTLKYVMATENVGKELTRLAKQIKAANEIKDIAQEASAYVCANTTNHKGV
jgi:hypothetical protein